MTSSRLVCDRRGKDGGLKTLSDEEVGVVGEWKVAPFLRTMLVLIVKTLESGRVTGVLRGLDDMVAEDVG
jgi:hypothetical protein